MRDSEWVTISASVEAETEKAFKIARDLDGGGTDAVEWLPKSQVRDPEVLEVGMVDLIEVRRWLAEDRDWPEAG